MECSAYPFPFNPEYPRLSIILYLGFQSSTWLFFMVDGSSLLSFGMLLFSVWPPLPLLLLLPSCLLLPLPLPRGGLIGLAFPPIPVDLEA